MILDPNQVARMKRDTREASSAFLEDIQHFRNVVASPNPDRTILRQLTTSLRRILLDNELAKVAGPRVGDIHIQARNISRTAKSWPEKAPGLFIAGGAPIFGMTMKNIVMCPVEIEQHIDTSQNQAFLPVKRDRFLSQKVLYFNGYWISREDIIKYIAYVASGIYPKKDNYVATIEHKVIAQIRSSAAFVNNVLRFEEGVFHVPRIDDDPPFEYAPEKVDVVLWELLSMANYLAESPEIVALEAVLKTELGVT